MNFKLVTFYDANYAMIGELSSSIMQLYCRHHGYQFVRYNHLPDPNRGPQWNKIRICQQELDGCDWLVWMDADSLPVNYRYTFEDLIALHPDKELIFSGDDNGACAGIFLIKNSSWSRQLLETWWFAGQMDREYAKRYHPSPQNDQPTILALMANFPSIRDRIGVMPESVVCNPRSAFHKTAWAVHYWQSDAKLGEVAGLMKAYYEYGWCQAAHRRIEVVTCANAAMADVLEISRTQTEQLGYKVNVYDLGGLGYGTPFFTDYDFTPDIAERKRGRIPMKPAIIRTALQSLKRAIVFMDADAFAIRGFDEMNTSDYDVAVTMRRQTERNATRWPLLYGFLNSGVMFFNHTDAAFKFIDLWESNINGVNGSDQEALNRTVLQCTDLTEYDAVFMLGDIRVKILKCDDYNFYYWPQEPHATTRICHAKTNVREALMDWGKRDWSKKK